MEGSLELVGGLGGTFSTIEGVAAEISPLSWITFAMIGPGRKMGPEKSNGYLRLHRSWSPADGLNVRTIIGCRKFCWPPGNSTLSSSVLYGSSGVVSTKNTNTS